MDKLSNALRALTVLLVVLLIALQSSAISYAQTATPAATPAGEVETVDINRAISFYPEEGGEGTFITVELNPGESAEVNVILGNSGEVEQTLRTYAIPALTAANGGFVLADYGAENDEITTWLDYPEQSLTFQPTEGVRIPVSIEVPTGTLPGEYVTGLAAEQGEAYEVPGTDMFQQRTRWAIPVLIVVPGDREPSFDLTGAELEWYEGAIFGTIEIVNTGNVTLRPEGEVRLLNAEGTVIGVSEIALGSIYTGTNTTFGAAWSNIPVSDSYSIQVLLSAEEGTDTADQMFENLVPLDEGDEATIVRDPLIFTQSELTPLTKDVPPSMLSFNGLISNNGDPIEDARVSIVTYQDGVEVDRYPILQAVTIEQGETPVEARYSLPGGFTDGAYTFEVTIEIGSSGTQTVLVTQPIDFEVVVGD